MANVDFGNNGASSLTVTAAGKAGGILEIRLDDPDSEPVASISIPAGDGSEYADYTTTLEGVTGVHHVVFSFKSDGGATSLRTLSRSRRMKLLRLRWTSLICRAQ